VTDTQTEQPRADPTVFEDCGTERAYWRHAKRRERADKPCRDAHAKAAQKRRTETATPRVLPPCGTSAAYARHVYHREPVDLACRTARTRDNRILDEARRLAAAIFPESEA